MPDLSDFPPLDVAIGLAFMYFLLSVVCSSISEAIASVLKLRAKNLEQGIRVLVGDKAKAQSLYDSWRIRGLHTPKWFGRSTKKEADATAKGRKPSYIPSRTFALAFLDTFAPDAALAAKTADPKQPDSANVLANLEKDVKAELPAGAIGTELILDAIHTSEGRIDVLRGKIEDAFNETMDRATGWYKRKVQIILFLIAVAVAGGLNADTFNVAQRLYQDNTVRAAVVGQAVTASQQAAPDTDASTPAQVEQRIKEAKATALPLGWRAENVQYHAKYRESLPAWLPALGLKIGGILLTAFALLLGGPFWFDLLGRFARLRSSGNRIGTPKDDETAPIDRDERKVTPGGGAGGAPPPPIAEAEREKAAEREQDAAGGGAAKPHEVVVRVQVDQPPRRGLLGRRD
ncbi:MAG TPA: hypothetical protein VF549_18625 [Solirubrobacteraceae bacterium]|jgi:hypothetical protein